MRTRKAGEKTALRKQLRLRRRSLPHREHAERSSLAARAILRLPRFSAGRRVAIYLPFDGETDTAALLAAARRRGLRVFVPVVMDRRRRRIAFYPLTADTRRGAYGIRVPRRTAAALGARWLSLMIVPLVGVDPEGRRLGMGGGYYDRVVAFRTRRTHWMGPRLIGFAFDCQRVDSVHAETWDLRLDALATESGMRHFHRTTT